jgi:hypothetical protein
VTAESLPIQVDFTLFRMAALAEQDPALKGRPPYRAAVESAFVGMGVEAFGAEVLGWRPAVRRPGRGGPHGPAARLGR